MEHNSSWEANSSSASEEIPEFYGARRFITAFTSAATCPYPKPDESQTHNPSCTSIWQELLIISQHT